MRDNKNGSANEESLNKFSSQMRSKELMNENSKEEFLLGKL
jgi:hypothetical protein